MASNKDFYTYKVITPLKTKNGQPIGTSIATYEVRRHQDVCNLSDKFAYRIISTYRVIALFTLSVVLPNE